LRYAALRLTRLPYIFFIRKTFNNNSVSVLFIVHVFDIDRGQGVEKLVREDVVLVDESLALDGAAQLRGRIGQVLHDGQHLEVRHV